MNMNSKIMVLGMVFLMLAGCGESNEKKVLAQTQNGEGAMRMSKPDCAKRDPKTHRYQNGRGCTDAERAAFDKQRGL